MQVRSRSSVGIPVRLLAFASVVAAAGLCLSGCGAAGASSVLRHQGCRHIADLYAASDAQLAKCNLRKVPLTSTTPLPGGGLSYNYKLPDGQVYSVVQAPVGFNALHASRAEAAAYGIPPRPPRTSPGYATWKRVASAPFARVTPHPYLVVGLNASSSWGLGTGGAVLVRTPKLVGQDMRDATCAVVGAHLRWRFPWQQSASGRPESGCGGSQLGSSMDDIEVLGQAPAPGTSIPRGSVVVLRTMCTPTNPCS